MIGEPVTLRREALRAQDRAAILAASNGRCAHCGTSDVPLEIRHIVPRREGGTLDRSNLEAVCPNCHRVLDSTPSEIHFLSFLTALLEAAPDFTIEEDSLLGKDAIQPDLLVTEAVQSGAGRRLLIECKSFPVLSSSRVDDIRALFGRYREALPGRQLVLAFPGKATPDVIKGLRQDSIEIWDIDRIGTRFADQIELSNDSYYSDLIQRALARLRPEAKLLSDVMALPPGRDGWNTYQKLIGRLLELLFCPPLGSPFPEKNDFDKVNRRDLIFANHVSEGFWAAIRQRYGADYILVDAKNGKKVKKQDVLQIANYLKPHGVGQFAIIMSREGPDRGATAVLREQWAFHRKMILVLNDKDLEEMVLGLTSGEQTKVLVEKIQAFRIGM